MYTNFPIIFELLTILVLYVFLKRVKVGAWKNSQLGERMYIVRNCLAKTVLTWRIISGMIATDYETFIIKLRRSHRFIVSMPIVRRSYGWYNG
jgi:hypothetical protein